MQISVSDIGKRFNRDWIFRKFSHEFINGNSYAITGPNGSGKSTLLQILAGAISPSEGEIRFLSPASGAAERSEGWERQLGAEHDLTSSTKLPRDRGWISSENAFKYLSIAAPYQELIEEMTLEEFLQFHSKFKPLTINVKQAISILGLESSSQKQIRYFSSGMKQRVKLAQAIFSDTACVLLDEPCTNLDIDGIKLYQRLIEEYCANRLVIVSSNDIQEYGFCKEIININDYKLLPVARN